MGLEEGGGDEEEGPELEEGLGGDIIEEDSGGNIEGES